GRLAERLQPSVVQPPVEGHVEIGDAAADRPLHHVLGPVLRVYLVELRDELDQCGPALLDACHDRSLSSPFSVPQRAPRMTLQRVTRPPRSRPLARRVTVES